MSDIDPAAIMAEHAGHGPGVWAKCPSIGLIGKHCIPYALAIELLRRQREREILTSDIEKLRAENAELREQRDTASREVHRLNAEADDLRAAEQRVRATVDQVDQARTASIMVSAIYAALDGAE